ncbi:MAG TPA: hypothetical protein VK524_26850 [Polyangiaceae bacterium]|nr:hypothetical protein [Polyangiaceae bacterium]
MLSLERARIHNDPTLANEAREIVLSIINEIDSAEVAARKAICARCRGERIGPDTTELCEWHGGLREVRR